jgi:hypothetical protein
VLFAQLVIAALSGGVIAGLLVAFFLRSSNRLPAQSQRVIRAESFTVIDREGKEKAVLGLAEGRPILVLTDSVTESEIALHIASDGMFLRFFSASASERPKIPRIGLGTLRDGTPGLELADLNGRRRALLGIDPNRSSFLKLTDHNGEAEAFLVAPAVGAPSLTISDSRGKSLI